MKKFIGLLLGLWLLAPSVGEAADAVVFTCESNGAGDMVIVDFDKSARALSFTVGSSCAAAIASLYTNTYILRAAVALSDGKVLYTFTK